jgi:arabinose-5-phosphate isomerase
LQHKILLTDNQILQTAKDTILLESSSLLDLSAKLTKSFVDATKEILNSQGRVVVTGIGKSAIIGQKIVATLNSTGTPALFMHAADAIHGDLGMIQLEDVVICISKSGTSPEIKILVPLLKNGGNTLIGMVGDLGSFLSTQSDIVLDTTVSKEACPNNLAPTTSTTAQLAMGDALAVALLSCKNFKSEDFAKYHPGGALGKRLHLRLADIAANNSIPTVQPSATLPETILAITEGRMGAVIVVEEKGVKGIVTDGDLRRMLSQQIDLANTFAKDIMTHNPKTMDDDAMAIEGVDFIKKHSINHIILTHQGEISGVVHIQDLIKEGLI